MSEPVKTTYSPATGGNPINRQVSICSARIRTHELLGEQRMIRIEHNGDEYVLRITKNNKLILTK